MAENDLPTAPQVPGQEPPEEVVVSPRPTREEDLLQSASANMDSSEELDSTPPAQHEPLGLPPKKSRKKQVIALLVVVLLIAIAAGATVLLKKKPVGSNNNQSENQSPPAVTQTYIPENVVYGFRANTNEPVSIYYRPAGGGERKEVLKLESRDAAPFISDVQGTNVVFSEDDAIYVSTNSGLEYKKVVTLAEGEQVTSLKFSTDGSAIAYGSLLDSRDGNTVKTIELDGKSTGQLFKSEVNGVFLYKWNKGLQKVYYAEGCYNCDGAGPGDMLRDLKDNKVTNPATKGEKLSLPVDPEISDDFSTIVYVEGVDPAIESREGVGYLAAPPYKVQVVDVAKGTKTVAATVGKAGEKNNNGTLRDWSVRVGLLAGKNTPYYTEDAKLFTITDGKPSLTYTADKTITGVYYASDKQIIASLSDSNSADYSLVTYDIGTKQPTQIFAGDAETYLFGITTK